MNNYKALVDGRNALEEEIVEKILEVRKITVPKDEFLHPSKEYILPSETLKNIDKAYDIVSKYICVIEPFKIGILYDVDTDGITAGTIIDQYLQKLGIIPSVFINCGKIHGLIKTKSYWNEITKLDLLIIVDSLNDSPDTYIELKKEHNVDVVILDHHQIKYELSNEYTLVSSQNEYGNEWLSGAGVTWKFCKYFDEQHGTTYSDDLVDLAAVGILADVMDISNMENRAIVYEGLKNLKNPTLKEIVGSYKFDSTSVLFSVAPLINAANRLNQNELALKAFKTTDKKELKKIIKELKACKTKQDEIIAELLPEARKICDEQKNSHVLFVDIKAQGLNGLLAQKLASIYNKPVIVCSPIQEHYYGSIRSTNSIDFAKLINDTGLARADGHSEAAGFSMEIKNKDNFVLCINKSVARELSEIDTTIYADVYVEPDDLSVTLCKKIAELDFVTGKNFKPILFLLTNVKIDEVSSMKDGQHLKIISNGIEFIKWNTPVSVMEYEIDWLMGKTFDCIGTLSLSSFGNKVQVILDEIYINK